MKKNFLQMVLPYVVAIAVAGAAIVAFVTFNQSVFDPVSENAKEILVSHMQNTVGTTTSSIANPTQLIISSINLNAKIQHVGITYKGNVGIPTNFTDVGWYKYGPHPGDIGTAIVDGHVDNALGMSGVFVNLRDIAIGDTVTVLGSDGSKVTFKVTDKKEYDYTETIKDIFPTSNTQRLVLITCTGDWEQSVKSYSKRLVVTAEVNTV